MAGDAEAPWESGVSVELAALQLKDFAAAVAAEVVVMSFSGDLIPQGFARHGNGCKPVILQQRADVAIYGGDTQTFNLGLRRTQYLFRGKWPVCPLKCFADRCFLACVTRLCGQVATPSASVLLI